ncbi:MAG TPA: universal stress protein [Kofleriaceae bacterium]
MNDAEPRGLIREKLTCMKLPSRILVPTDFSELATCALDYAVALAHKLEATIHLLNAMSLQFAEYPIAITTDMIDGIMQSSQKELEKLIAARAGQASFGPPILDVGDARIVIEQAAIKLGADLIVMGTHGRQGLKRVLLGSVAESLVRTAPCPVLLVRANNAPA